MALNSIISQIGSGLQQYRQDAGTSGLNWPDALAVYITNWEDMSLAGTLWASGFSISSGASVRLPPRSLNEGNLPNRRYIHIFNADNTHIVYIGQSGINQNTGYPLPTGQSIKLSVAGNIDIYGFTEGSSVKIKTLETS